MTTSRIAVACVVWVVLGASPARAWGPGPAEPTLVRLALESAGALPAPPSDAPPAFAIEPWTPDRPELASSLALAMAEPDDQVGSGRLDKKKPRDRSMAGTRGGFGSVMGGERARILLRSLTVPGWGQATAGRRTAASIFALAETGVWASFTAFRIQQTLRRHSYERTAELFAGIDLEGRDEEYRRIVGLYASSEEYNRLVVYRDAANQHYGETEAYNRYIAEHEIKGADAWEWTDGTSFQRYRDQRQATQRAGLRANTALALAIANRLVSAIHAARYAGTPAATAPRSWNIECVPVGNDPTAFHLGVRASF